MSPHHHLAGVTAFVLVGIFLQPACRRHLSGEQETTVVPVYALRDTYYCYNVVKNIVIGEPDWGQISCKTVSASEHETASSGRRTRRAELRPPFRVGAVPKTIPEIESLKNHPFRVCSRGLQTGFFDPKSFIFGFRSGLLARDA